MVGVILPERNLTATNILLIQNRMKYYNAYFTQLETETLDFLLSSKGQLDLFYFEIEQQLPTL
jgi:hypothetical protein